MSSSGVAVQLLSPTWDEAAVAAAAVPATTSSTFPLFSTLTVLVLPFLSLLLSQFRTDSLNNIRSFGL